MKGKKDFSKVASDISVLYELSLAVGQSLDLRTNCDHFLKTLMARKNLGYASVWIKGEYIIDSMEERDENSAFLVYANPQSYIREKSLSLRHPIFFKLKGKDAFSITSTENGFSEIITEKGVDRGTFAIFALGKLGFLKLFSMVRKMSFREEELNQLNNVISKLTISLEGCIAHQKLIQEIEERKRAEEALEKSEEKFRELYDDAPVGYHEFDTEGRITRVNRTELEMLRYTEEEMLGRYVWDFIAEEVSREAVKAKLAGKSPPGRTFERTYRRKDGTTFPVLIEDRLIKDGEGRITGIRTTIQDITERKRAEKAIQRSEEEAQRLAQENAIMAEISRIISSTLEIEKVYELFAEEVRKVIPFDRIAINILYFERDAYVSAYIAGKDVTGHRPGDIIRLAGSLTEEVARTRSSMFIQKDDIDEMVGMFPGLLPNFQAGLRSLIAVPLISKDQGIGVLHVQSTKPNAYTETDLKLAERVGHQIAGAIANAQLFRERKQVEGALRESEEKYRTIIDNIEDGYYEVDLAGNFTFFNDALSRSLGYSRDELMGMNDRQYTDKENAKRLFQTFNTVYRTGSPAKGFDWEIIRKDGTKRYVEASVSLIRDPGGQPIGFRGIVRDVTERKRAEKEMIELQEQLRQSQKMEAVGRLAGGIAHDFNNILTVIKGYSQLSLSELKEDHPLRENIEGIQKATDRASDLIRKILAFGRRQVMEMRVIDLNTLLMELDKLLRRVIGEDIELATVLAEDLGRAKVDPGQIEQVILNLAVNAKDAMPNGGKLTIETANTELDEAYARSHIAVTPGPYVMLSVSDTGVGMTSEVKERIFEPFYTTKEKDKGTGLGLSTVYGIVKQSGGNIWVYSEPAQGTTFKIYLPRVDELAEEVREKVVKEEQPRGSETVLVVEDEKELRKLAVRILEKQGYKVLEASHGHEALSISEKYENKIHLLVTDVVMPNMSGRELSERLMSLCPEIKILYMSGHTNSAIVHHGVLEPGVNLLQKPFTPEALARKVREVLDR